MFGIWGRVRVRFWEQAQGKGWVGQGGADLAHGNHALCAPCGATGGGHLVRVRVRVRVRFRVRVRVRDRVRVRVWDRVRDRVRGSVKVRGRGRGRAPVVVDGLLRGIGLARLQG